MIKFRYERLHGSGNLKGLVTEGFILRASQERADDWKTKVNNNPDCPDVVITIKVVG